MTDWDKYTYCTPATIVDKTNSVSFLSIGNYNSHGEQWDQRCEFSKHCESLESKSKRELQKAELNSW